MMKNRIIAILALISLSATGCNNWLDVRPGTEEPADQMFETYEGYKNALTGCYIKLKSRSLYGENLTITTVEYLAQHWDYEANTNELADKTKQHNYEDDMVKDQFQSIYAGLYNVIVQANTIIEAMPKTGMSAISDADARGVIEGEAHAMRAMCHFEILRLFGQVPGGSASVSLPYTEGVSRIPQGHISYQQFVQKIENDLNIAAELLEKHDPFVDNIVRDINSTKIEDEYLRYRQLRLNYWAVKALQARFYTYVGKMDEAYRAAMTVIDMATEEKGLQLAGTANIAAGYLTLPSEGLFMLSNHNLKDYVNTLFPGYAGESISRTNLYLNPEKLTGIGMFEESLNSSTNNRLRNLWNHTKKDRFGQLCPELMKYYQGDAANMGSSALLLYKQLVPMLRLSEMYLIAMEASNDMAEINKLYEPYQIARGATNVAILQSKEQTMEMIEKEYRREFFGEGQMFSFYKRNARKSMLWSEEEMTEENYIIPLPLTEYDSNQN